MISFQLWHDLMGVRMAVITLGQHHGLARWATSFQQRSSLQTISAPREHTETHGFRIWARKRALEGELHRQPAKH